MTPMTRGDGIGRHRLPMRAGGNKRHMQVRSLSTMSQHIEAHWAGRKLVVGL